MLRWSELLLWSIGRFYGLVFVALGGVFFYWGIRGLLAYSNGTRAAWSEPAVCVVGFLAGGLSLWIGVRLVRSGIPSDRLARGQGELDATVDAAMKLERTDPAAAYELMDRYFIREAAATEARRAELRQRAPHDRDAAVELRRELQDELTTNALNREDVVKRASADQRASLLAQIDAADRDLRAELVQLDAVIERPPLC